MKLQYLISAMYWYNTVKTDFDLNCMQNFSSHLTENTVCSH